MRTSRAMEITRKRRTESASVIIDGLRKLVPERRHHIQRWCGRCQAAVQRRPQCRSRDSGARRTGWNFGGRFRPIQSRSSWKPGGVTGGRRRQRESRWFWCSKTGDRSPFPGRQNMFRRSRSLVSGRIWRASHSGDFVRREQSRLDDSRSPSRGAQASYPTSITLDPSRVAQICG